MPHHKVTWRATACHSAVAAIFSSPNGDYLGLTKHWLEAGPHPVAVPY
jgi:hypothetical protein